jgi:hypothetical protein
MRQSALSFRLFRKHSAGEPFSTQQKGERGYGKERRQELDALFHDKDVYFAEKKILATPPKMERATQAPQLKRTFAKHKIETEGHVTRLVFPRRSAFFSCYHAGSHRFS